MKNRFLIWLGIFLLLPTFAWATPQPLHFTHLRTKDGLSHNEATSIVQDDKGFIWIATTYGLNRYDGTSIVTYLNENANPNSLPDNYLWDLYKGRDGMLWISSWGGGLSHFDLKTETFTNYYHDENNPNSLGDNQVWSVYEDSKGRVWVATVSGLSQLDVVTGVFTHYPLYGSDGKAHDATRIAEDRQGLLWVGTNGSGLHHFNPDTGESISYFHDEKKPDSINSDFVLSVYIDPQQTLWAGTSKGLAKRPHNQQQFTRYRSDPANPNSLSKDFIWSILGAASGELWLGTENGGLSIFDPKTAQFSNYPPDPNDNDGISESSVVSAFQDKNGYIWLATYGGVDIYNPDFSPFSSLSLSKQFSDPDVKAIYQDEQGKVWLGTKEGGLYRFEPHTHRIKRYLHTEGVENKVTTIYPDGNTGLWLGTDQGLSRFDKTTGRFDIYALPQDERVEDVATINTLTGREGSPILLVGSLALYAFDKASKQFTTLTPSVSSDTKMVAPWIHSLLWDNPDSLWVGSDGFFSHLNLKTGVFDAAFAKQASPNTGLSNGIAESLYQDSQGKLWIGTKNGLNQFDPVSKTFRTYFDTDGLGDNQIASIIEDNQHKLWIATSKNLSRFDPQTGQFKNYDQRDGIQTKGFNPRAVFRGSKGELFFGGEQGLTFFNPENMKENRQPPNVVLTGFQLFHQRVKPSPTAAIKQSLAYLNTITLTHDANTFGFEFVALNYWSGSKNQYAYQLEGFDKDWIHTDSQHRTATFTNVAPGIYTFRVKASNNDGVWNAQGTSLQVVVLHPWWQTGWFKGISVAVFLTTLWLLYQWRIRTIWRHNQQLEQQVQQRTQALQATQNAQTEFIATMSHELRTPMHAIGSLVTLLKLTPLTEPQQQYLSRLSFASSHMKQTIGKVLDFGKIQSGQFELQHQPFHLGVMVSHTMAMLEPLASCKNLRFTVEGETWLDANVQGDRRYLSQTLTNLLGNALKHTETGYVTLRIQPVASASTDTLSRHFAVEDSGCGIAPDQLPTLFEPYQQVSSAQTGKEGTGLGLTISKTLVALMGGELQVSSTLGKGSCFHFTLCFEPVATQSAPELLDGSTTDAFTLPAGLHVLLVDDAEINRFVGQSMLENLGTIVTLAENGEQALLHLQQSDFDLLLIDITMPVLDGLETTRQLRQLDRNQHIPVIALTAHALPEYQQRAKAAGMNGFLHKPFEYEELYQAMVQTLATIDG